MTFAASNEDTKAKGGAAVWDIFPSEATEKIRAFLRSTTNRVDDPIMRQTFYITPSQLIQLREQYNVIPWRIFQNPGDAVFIPAGCAHQVFLSRCY
jgi:[histone H3]-dimethyl-L-lysine9 demethylase